MMIEMQRKFLHLLSHRLTLPWLPSLSLPTVLKMWKKLHSLTPISNNLLRRKRIAPPCTAATASEIVPNQNRLLEFASPISSSRKFQEHESSFSSDFYSSRAFHIPRLHFGPPSHTTNLFRFVSTSTSPAASLRCWNCNALPSSTTPFLVCQSCRSVQPVDHAVDFFQILGVSVFFSPFC